MLYSKLPQNLVAHWKNHFNAFTNCIGQEFRCSRDGLSLFRDIWASDGETQMLRADSFTFFFLAAMTEMTQRLGLAHIAAQITNTWPLHVAWASHNMVLGSKRESFENQVEAA